LCAPLLSGPARRGGREGTSCKGEPGGSTFHELAFREAALLLLVVVHDFELRIDHVAVVLAWTAGGRLALWGGSRILRAARCRACASRGVLVQILARTLERVLQVRVGGLDRLDVVALQRFAHRGDLRLDARLLLRRELVA